MVWLYAGIFAPLEKIFTTQQGMIKCKGEPGSVVEIEGIEMIFDINGDIEIQKVDGRITILKGARVVREEQSR